MTGAPSAGTPLFLDFDGVVAAPSRKATSGIELARHADELLMLAVEKFQPRWLTTHREGVYRRFDECCTDPDVRQLARGIPVAEFTTLKTEALADLTSFFWLEDRPMHAERQWLVEQGKLDGLLLVDVRTRPDDLAAVIASLRHMSS